MQYGKINKVNKMNSNKIKDLTPEQKNLEDKMFEHKQVEVEIDGYSFTVDEGLEDIIKIFFHWSIETCNSCIDNNDKIWIEFREFYDWKIFMQLVLHDMHNNIARDNDYEETLWYFIEENANVTLVTGEEIIFDPNNRDTVMGIGVVDISVSLRFPKELLNEFKELFFEAFPSK